MSFEFSKSAQAANILSGLGGVVQGVGQFITGRQQVAAGDYNAAIFEQQAQAERTSQLLLEEQKRRVIKSQLGTQTALIAASGIKMTGSPVEVMLDSLTNANLDLMIDRYNSEVRARGFESSAQRSRYEGRQAAARSYTGAASSLLSTAADLFRSQREIGAGRGTQLGPGRTEYGINVPSRYVPPK